MTVIRDHYFNVLNSALMQAPPEFRHELKAYVAERASTIFNEGELHAVIAEGRQVLGSCLRKFVRDMHQGRTLARRR